MLLAAALRERIDNMARRKRIDAEAVLNTDKRSIGILKGEDSTQYHSALYVRLSVEDSGKRDGNSLENQISLLKSFAEGKPELLPYKLYVDNGESGTGFERPQFTQMIQDMKNGAIRCIIVKDLSRLGRNYLEAGKYLEQVFPAYGVRFISIADHYDSSDNNHVDEGMLIPLRNMMNESYARDISRKIRGTFTMKMKQGKFLGTYPPYGYQKDPEDKGHLIVDPVAAENVKKIFQWKADGKSLGEIARTLNEEGVLAPFRYFYSIGLLETERHKESLWTRLTVKKLLMKRMYIGDMVCGKERSSFYDGYQKKAMPEQEWFIVEGTHEPLIEKELFWKVQKMLDDNKRKYDEMDGCYGDFKPENLFRGKIECGICGSAMKLTKEIKKSRGKEYRIAKYICNHYAEYHNEDCKKVFIHKHELDDAVMEDLKYHMRTFLEMDKALTLLNRLPQVKKVHDSYIDKIMKIKARIDKIQILSAGIYEDYREGLLTEQEYIRYRRSYAKERDRLESQCSSLENEKEPYAPEQDRFREKRRLIEQEMDFSKLSRELVQVFIEKVVVYEEKRIKVIFTFRDEFEEVIHRIIQRKGEVMDGKEKNEK